MSPVDGRSGLAGLRVVELAGGVGVAWAAKLFADLGATVIRVEGEDDLVRARPHDLHLWLNTNKRSVTGGAEELIAGADLVIHDHRRDGAPDIGGWRRSRPQLVVLSLTPFGLTGPYSRYAAEEINLIHGSSWGFLSPANASDPQLPPLKAPGHHASITVATVAATVGLAAVDHAQRTGAGDHVDFSSFAAAAKITEFAPAVVSFLGADASRLGGRTVVPWDIYRCADGLIQFICPEQAQWEAFVELMGSPEWAQLEIFADGAGRSANADLVNLYIGEWMATQQVDELYHAAQKARVAMTPVNTMAQLDRNSQLEARRFFATTPEGQRQPGPGFRFDRPWWGLRTAAPDRGAHDDEGWADELAGAATPLLGPSRRPLDGVRVCDFTWIWAGPACTQILAHLGADVVKLESPDHLCMFRRLPFHPDGLADDPDAAGAFQIYNTDKRSLGIDISLPAAREVVSRLVAHSDVVVDNFGVGTMASLGFGVEDLRAINPEVVVASLTGYGQTGPSAGYMAYGPAGGALAGLYAANGYGDGRVYETGIAIGDPGTGITAAWAITAALVARRRTADVAMVDVAMVEAVAATVGELWASYQREGISPAAMGNHDLQWAPHNCYPALGEDCWVTIVCTDDTSWAGLCEVVDPALVDDPRFATGERRKANEGALDSLLSAWTSTKDRWDVTELLQGAGVAAFPSLSPAELWGGDIHLEARGMLERPAHPVTGHRVVPGVPWRLGRGDNGLRRPAPCLGEDTGEILTDLLGYSATEVADLVTRGVVHRAAPGRVR